MTYEEALKLLEKISLYLVRRTSKPLNVDFVNTLKKALKKQIPKKPKYKQCPNCSTGFSFITENLANPEGHKIIYCWNCGQSIDWSD